MSGNEMTPADIAAVTGRNNSGDGMFGGNGAWWIIILFLFVFCGWGGGWEARGSYSRYNEGGNSYARSGQHYVRAHYSRDGGSMEEELERLMQKADGQREREMIQRLMDELKKR